MIRLLSSFLTNRHLRVHQNSAISNKMELKAGTPRYLTLNMASCYWSGSLGYFDYWTFVARYCFKYDLMWLNIILIIYCNVKSTGLPLGLFSTDAFWNCYCFVVI